MLVIPISVVVAPDVATGQVPTPIHVDVDAADGRGRSDAPGRACSDGVGAQAGAGAYWHYEYGTELAPGVFSSLPGDALVHLDLHSDVLRYQNTSGVYPEGTNPRAFLQGEESHATLLNDRGGVKIRLVSGTCDAPTLAFDGAHASGDGTWYVADDDPDIAGPDGGTGAYRDIQGSGTFRIVDAEVNPGADNRLELDLDGSFTLPAPRLAVEVISTFWASLGTDYLSRRVTVVYRITNVGDGDAYGARLTNVTSQPGAAPMVSLPIPLGDLPAGASTSVSFRHQLELLGPPCTLIILGCTFQTTMTVSMPDALDQPNVQSATVAAKAPLLPPPL